MKNKIICCVLCVLLLSACTQQEKIFEQVEAVLNESPEDALDLLARIDSSTLSAPKQGMYNLYYAQAEDKSMKEPITERYVKDAFQYYADKIDHKNYALSQYYMGKLYISQHKNYDGETCFLNAIKAALKHKDYYTTYMAEEKLSKALMVTDFRSSLKYAQDALKHYEEINNDPDNKAYLEMNIATILMVNDSIEATLWHLHKVDTILHYETLQNAEEVRKSLFQTYINIYLYIEKYDKAQIYADSLSKFDNLNKTQYNLITYSYALDGKQQEATNIFKQLLPRANMYQKNSIYYQLLLMQLQEQNDKIGTLYFDSLMKSIDVIFKQLSEDKTQYFKKELETELQKERNHQEAILREVILVFVFVLLLLTVVFIFLHFHQRAKRRAAIAAERLKLQSKFNQEKIDLMRKYLLEKITIIKSLSPYLDGSVKKLVLSDKEWAEIEVYLNVTFNNVIMRLRRSYPQLSLKDFQFVQLICLGFTNTQLANYYGIAEKSIKQNSYLLKQKLNVVDSATSLRMFLCDFCPALCSNLVSKK